VSGGAPNAAPSLTSFTGPVDSTSEESEVEISFAELAAAGDESDSDGTVDAFVVQAVFSGTLLIGADAGWATPFAVGSNDVIGAGLNAYWTPPADLTGVVDAFSVTALDDDGAESAVAITAQVTVAPVNDPPSRRSTTRPRSACSATRTWPRTRVRTRWRASRRRRRAAAPTSRGRPSAT
jgi:hypothetical protein